MPPRRACKTCLNACWDKFERYGEPTVRFSDSWRRQMRDEARTLECEVKDLLNGKARGCQICYAIFRGISNLVWPAFRGPFERALSSTLRSSIILVRSRGRPLEVRADLMVDQPLPIGEEESYVSILPAPRGRRLITVTFEIYSEQGNLLCVITRTILHLCITDMLQYFRRLWTSSGWADTWQVNSTLIEGRGSCESGLHTATNITRTVVLHVWRKSPLNGCWTSLETQGPRSGLSTPRNWTAVLMLL